MTKERMTLFNPGQSPPQVTIPARVFDGSKKSRRRAPAGSSPVSWLRGKPSPLSPDTVLSSKIRSDSST